MSSANDRNWLDDGPSHWPAPAANLDPEEMLLALQDVLTDVAAGRPDGHTCPRCGEGALRCEHDEARGSVEVSCPKCRLHFEGVLSNGYE